MREQQKQALKLWQEKKTEFELELVTTSNPELKFELRQRIRECNQEMQRLNNNFEAENRTLEVFFSYAHEDEELRNELAKHLSTLQRHDVISAWYDRDISAGTEWAGEIDTHLNSAQIILLLISPDFMASDYCFDIEMKRAMERHEAGNACVIPVILRPTDWSGDAFRKLQALPKNAKPVTTWTNQDEAFLDIAKGIRKAIKSLVTTTNSIKINQVVSPSQEEEEANNNVSTVRNSFNQRKIERLQRDLNLAQKQSYELTELINVIVDESNENRGDAVRQHNLNKKKKRYQEERNQYEQEVERLQAEIDQLTNG